jgi:glycosyltransferase involved in cell wall biosynthesis
MKTIGPLRVGIVTTLEAGPGAGGHVKCWLRLAEAARAFPDRIDLSLHFLGETSGREELGINVRIHSHRAVLGTRQLTFLRQGGGDTDLSPFHPGLFASLSDRQVVHATDFFCFGRTGLIRARRHGVPFVASIHTDVPRFVPIYADEILARFFGQRATEILARRGFQDWLARRAARKIDRGLRHCRRVLVSKPEDRLRLETLFGRERVSYLRRGID